MKDRDLVWFFLIVTAGLSVLLTMADCAQNGKVYKLIPMWQGSVYQCSPGYDFIVGLFISSPIAAILVAIASIFGGDRKD